MALCSDNQQLNDALDALTRQLDLWVSSGNETEYQALKAMEAWIKRSWYPHTVFASCGVLVAKQAYYMNTTKPPLKILINKRPKRRSQSEPLRQNLPALTAELEKANADRKALRLRKRMAKIRDDILAQSRPIDTKPHSQKAA